MHYEAKKQEPDVATHDKVFLAFMNKVNQEMGPQWEMLRQPLSDVVEEMKAQMRKIDGFKARLIFLKAEAKHFLANGIALKKPPKDPKVTDLDRKAILEARITNEKALVDILDETLDLINSRVSMGQTMLKDETAQRRTG